MLSTETGAELGYNGTRLTNLQDAYSQFAAGFQRIVWHIWGAGWSYGSFAVARPRRPGHGFQYWGTRNPESADYDELNAHLGRVQQLMQTGKSRTDVGFINQKWVHGISKPATAATQRRQRQQQYMNWQLAHQGIYYRSTELQDNGYTYDYFSPKFLFDDDVSLQRADQDDREGRLQGRSSSTRTGSTSTARQAASSTGPRRA